MSAKPKKPEEGGPKVPAYIVTFSDMITLLLTFFVMLLSLATVQDPELFEKARDSFNDSLNNVGLGMLAGNTPSPDMGRKMFTHAIPNPDDETTVRTIDADEEQRRRAFKKISESMQTLKSQIVADSIRYTVSRVRFPESAAVLNQESKKHLDQFSMNLTQDAREKKTKVYVLGLAADVKGLKNQWILSARRAQAAAAYLKTVLPDTGQYPVFCWGSGDGGHWAGESGFVSSDAHILMAVLR